MKWASPWQGASRCTDSATSGCRALLAWLLEEYPQGRSMGIFNCRSVRGSSTKSLHGEGRALDYGLPMVGGRGNPIGHEIVKRLGQAGNRLGIQSVIYDRRIWSAKSPNGRPYTGQHPHFDHLHIEMTSTGARSVTLATFRSVLGGGGKRSWFGRGDKGDQVKNWQRQLNEVEKAGLKADGSFGPATEKATKAFQTKHGLTADGKVGRKTLDAMKAATAAASSRGGRSWFGLGDKGDQVKAWQRQLNEREGAGLKVDGSFGPATERATKAFQTKRGLTADGKVGRKTLAAMQGASA